MCEIRNIMNINMHQYKRKIIYVCKYVYTTNENQHTLPSRWENGMSQLRIPIGIIECCLPSYA